MGGVIGTGLVQHLEQTISAQEEHVLAGAACRVSERGREERLADADGSQDRIKVVRILGSWSREVTDAARHWREVSSFLSSSTRRTSAPTPVPPSTSRGAISCAATMRTQQDALSSLCPVTRSSAAVRELRFPQTQGERDDGSVQARPSSMVQPGRRKCRISSPALPLGAVARCW